MHDFVALSIDTTHRETSDALSVSFTIPDAVREAFRFRPGQHLAISALLDGEELRRTYSICSGPDDAALTVTIKRVPGGRFSGWAFEHLRPGITLNVMPPAGRFVLPDTLDQGLHVLAIAAGAGITPIMSMAEHAMRRSKAARFTLIYGNRDPDSIIFRERLEDLKDAFLGRFSLVHVLSRNQESDTPLLEGRITPEKIEAFAGHVFEIADIDEAFLCGPGSLIRDARQCLMALGLPRERIHHEFFASAAGAVPRPNAPDASAPLSATAPAEAIASEIVAIIDGRRHTFGARPGEAVIDAALRAGVRVPYACKGGMCSTCRARVVDGRARMRVNYSLEAWEIEKGFLLTCQALPDTPHLVVDFDQM
jgi:ring-1,2-phenylacetyl-CoA epoxidase subunit PaaE